MIDGMIVFDGTPAELAGRAADRVWLDDVRSPSAELAWIGGDGRWRNIGDPPPGAAAVLPTIEDGYLTVASAAREAAEAS